MKKADFLTMTGIGCISMAVLASEIVLTRIFSVTLWYHFAFLVISLALLGSGAAGVWLFLLPRASRPEHAPKLLPWLALGYALTNFLAFVIYQQIPLTMSNLRDGLDSGEIAALIFVYIELTIPFILAGATIALALRHYQTQAGRLYFADLVGASLGCLLSVLALNVLGGAGAMLATACLGALSALLLALASGGIRIQLLATAAATSGVVAVLIHVISPWYELRLHQTYNNAEPFYERWNSFSRITAYWDDWQVPFGWGISQRYYDQPRDDPGHMTILIDEKAGTPVQRHEVLPGGEDNWELVDFLAYDLTALPYYLREDAHVFIIGPGGGRDVLTALMFDADQIVGVELNPLIVELVQVRNPDYAGWVYNRENVSIYVDDARTYLAAHEGQFDIIQASLIDTFASTSAGAFALSENGIYTVEAFEEYYDHLADDGLVNFSRWYYADGPAETLRLVSVGLQAWENRGVADVTQHIVVLANLTPDRIVNEGLAGMLLKKTPFTAEELAIISAEADRLDFTILYAPGVTDASANPVAEFILTPDRSSYVASYPLDISPTTDNHPFFFSVVRIGDLGKEEFINSSVYRFGAEATRTLILTLGIATVLTFVLILLPLLVGRGGGLRQHRGGFFIGYYGMLGLGFILVEIPLIQKMSIYMGNPTYALVVILFSLLLFSGIGSFLTQRVAPMRMISSLRGSLIILIILVLGYVALMPAVLNATQGLQIELRALVVVVMLMPMGLLMGRPFPLGLRYVEAVGAGRLMPWLWAANGTLSVVGSVMATILAINSGFAAVFVLGVLAYVLALGFTFGFQTAPQPVTEVAGSSPAPQPS